ncbi:MAG TPA: Calx-beta domain-containing protein [Actinomycetota bacterium]
MAGRTTRLGARIALAFTAMAVVLSGAPVANAAPPSPKIMVSDVSVIEGDAGTGSATFRISYGGKGTALTVRYLTANATATAGADYTATSGTAALPSGGCKCMDVTVPVIGDTVDEADETFLIDLSNPSAGTLQDPRGIGTIVDDDAAPSLSVDDASAGEADGTLGLDVTLSAASGSTVTVAYATSDDTATAPADYAATSGTLTYAPGQTSKQVAVPLVDDAFDEADEDLTLTLSGPTNATITVGTASGTIVDDDQPSAISVDDVEVEEGDGGSVAASFTVALTNPSGSAVTVDYATADGTAVAGEDYAAAGGTVTFAAGDTSETVEVDVAGDLLDEDDETFTLQLSDESGAALDDAEGVATIQDDDPDPVVSIGDAIAIEDSTLSFPVTLDAASGRTVTVDYATSDGTATDPDDYAGSSGTVTFAPGDTAETIDVALVDDAIDEAVETMSVTLSGPSNAAVGDGSAVGTVVDDETAQLLIDDVTVAEGDAGSTMATFTVTLSTESASTVSVDYATADATATAGADYAAASGTLTFSPGDTSETVEVDVLGDALDEASETYAVGLTDPSNAPVADASGVGTITDDDPLPGLSVDDATGAEGGTATFTVSLDAPSGRTVTVGYATADGSATAGADYTSASGTLTFAPGDTSETVAVALGQDAADEPDETFALALSGATNATIAGAANGTGTVVDDDKATSTLTVKLRKRSATVTAKGVLEPATGTSKVTLLLQKKVGAKWKKVARKVVTVKGLGDRDGDGRADAAYTAKFSKLKGARYQLVARFAGSADAKPVTRKARIRV